MTERSFEERIAELNSRINSSKKIVFFSGAGVSTGSGIPDFRSKDGLYNNRGVEFERYVPEYLLSRKCLMDKPKVFFEFYRQKLDCRGIQPNVVHQKMAELERGGKDVVVVTQNIDGMHELAGSSTVRTIHGTTNRNYCVECLEVFADDEKDMIFKSADEIPRCPRCGGMVRPDVVLYGEQPKAEEWFPAGLDIYKADLVVVCGTSLTVYPAAGMVESVPKHKLVVVNRDETPADGHASLVFHEDLGTVFEKIKIKEEILDA